MIRTAGRSCHRVIMDAHAARETGVVLSREALARIVPGTTTYEDILKMGGGEPEEHEQLATPDRRTVFYRGSRIVPSAGGASGGWRPSAAGPWSSTRSRSRSTGTSSPTSRPACAARPFRRPGLDSDCQSPPYRLPPKAHTHAPPREACMAELTRRDVLKLAAVGAAAAVPGLPRAAQRRPRRSASSSSPRAATLRSSIPPEATSSNDIRNLVQHLRQPHEPPSGRQARTRPRRGVEAPGADDVGIQAAPGPSSGTTAIRSRRPT